MNRPRPNYTAEVEAALAARQAASTPTPTPPADDRPPSGHLRYHVAVEDNIVNGVGTPSQVAAQLRAMADQIDPVPRRRFDMPPRKNITR